MTQSLSPTEELIRRTEATTREIVAVLRRTDGDTDPSVVLNTAESVRTLQAEMNHAITEALGRMAAGAGIERITPPYISEARDGISLQQESRPWTSDIRAPHDGNGKAQR